MMNMDNVLPVNGVYRHSIDSKNRLFIPAKHREALGTPLVLYPSIRDSSIKMCSLAQWRDLNEKIAMMPAKDREPVQRFFNGLGDTVEPDAQGRITIKSELAKFGGLADTVVIVGCGTSAEIWSAEAYDRMQQAMDLSGIRASLESFGL